MVIMKMPKANRDTDRRCQPIPEERKQKIGEGNRRAHLERSERLRRFEELQEMIQRGEVVRKDGKPVKY